MARSVIEMAVRAGRYRRTVHPISGDVLCVYWDGKRGHMANTAMVSVIASHDQQLAEKINTNQPLTHWKDVESWAKNPEQERTPPHTHQHSERSPQ